MPVWLFTRGDVLRFASHLPLAFIFRAFGAASTVSYNCEAQNDILKHPHEVPLRPYACCV